MNIIATLTTAIKVLQATWKLAGYLDEIRDFVWQAENKFPESGSGRTRLKWVREQLEQSIQFRDKVEKLWPHVDTFIAWFVNKHVNQSATNI